MLNIEPIKLLSGSHANTAKTGSGCFMNVIAYLNESRRLPINLNVFVLPSGQSQSG